MSSESWGKQMRAALWAVRRMHSDSGRLLLDLDRSLPEYKSIYNSVATMDLSYDVKRGMFMAEGLLRHWVRDSEPDTVIAVNIAFWNKKVDIAEPIFIAAKLLYAEPLGSTPDRNKAWDPWFSYFDWQRSKGELAEAKPPSRRVDMLRVASIGVPLASITNESLGHELLSAVRKYTFN